MTRNRFAVEFQQVFVNAVYCCFQYYIKKTEEAGLNGYVSDLYFGDDPFECQTEPRVYRREISWFLSIPVNKFLCGT
jgi:hypothetical protein